MEINTHIITDTNEASLFLFCKCFQFVINHFVKLFSSKSQKQMFLFPRSNHSSMSSYQITISRTVRDKAAYFIHTKCDCYCYNIKINVSPYDLQNHQHYRKIIIKEKFLNIIITEHFKDFIWT